MKRSNFFKTCLGALASITLFGIIPKKKEYIVGILKDQHGNIMQPIILYAYSGYGDPNKNYRNWESHYADLDKVNVIYGDAQSTHILCKNGETHTWDVPYEKIAEVLYGWNENGTFTC